MTARRLVVGLLDTSAAVCAAAVARWPALERPFVAAGCAAGTTAGRAFYRRACGQLGARLRRERRAVRSVTMLGHSLLLDVSETAGHTAYFERGVYEPSLSAIVASLQEGDTFLDVGANLGFFTILGARAVGPRGHVFAFEPHPQVRARLVAALALNGVADWVEVSGGAVGLVTGERLKLHLSDRGLEFSSLVPHRAPAAAAGFTDSVEVDTVSLDDWFAEHQVDPALIKIDVEGAEDMVVGGITKTLRARPPRRIVCETTCGSDADRMLLNHGYRVRPLDAAASGNFVYDHGADPHP
ncbi:MAG: FkbM family methyltransferase [Acidobacteriota bacterium]